MIAWSAAMRRLLLETPTAGPPIPWDAACIGLGLALLLGASWWPIVPVVTATGLVILGATGATLARYRSSAALLHILLVHWVNYASLYALLLGATLHAAATRPANAHLPLALDLAASLLPIIAAVGLCRDALSCGPRAR